MVEQQQTTDLVAELRGWREGYGMSDDARRKLWLMRKAADEIERLQAVLTQIATGRNAAGEFCDFPVDTAAEALGIVPSAWPAREVSKP